MDEKIKKIKQELDEKILIFGNKVICVSSIVLTIVFALLDFCLTDYMTGDTATLFAINTVSVFLWYIIPIVSGFINLIINYRTKFKTKITKIIYLVIYWLLAIWIIFNPEISSDVVVLLVWYIISMAYLDKNLELHMGIITLIVIIIVNIRLCISSGNVKGILYYMYYPNAVSIMVPIASYLVINEIHKMLEEKAKAKKKFEEEKKENLLANKIQEGFLSKDFPNNDYYEIAAMMYPSKDVGGDFYDFFMIDDSRMVVLIADVSGKGVPASLLMGIAKITIYSCLSYAINIEKALEKANRIITNNNKELEFITIFVVVVDLSTGEFGYINAGHNKPCIIRKNANSEFIMSKPDTLFGIDKGTRYHLYNERLEKGDKLFLYTDGVVERQNDKRELYSKERLIQLLENNKNKNSNQLIDIVKNDLDVYANGYKQNDDITCIVLEYKKELPKKEIIEKEFNLSEEKIDNISIFVKNAMEENKIHKKTIYAISVALDEIVSNICKYAYEENEKKLLKIELLINDDMVGVRFTDYGKYFDPLSKIDKTHTTKVTPNSKIGGLGIKMVWNMMSDMYYSRVDDKNVLTIKKEF